MGPLLLAVLAAAPALELAPDARCAPELRASGLKFDASGSIVLRLTPGPPATLTLINRSGEVLLRRALGNGSCTELSRASRVVVERWAQQLGPTLVDAGVPVTPVVVAPKKKPTRTQEPTADAGTSEISAPGAHPSVADAGTPEIAASDTQTSGADASIPEIAMSEAQPPIADVVTREIAKPERAVEPPAVEPVDEVRDAGSIIADQLVPDAGTTPIEVSGLEAFLGGGAVTPAYSTPIGPVLSAELALVLERRIRIGLVGLFDFGGTTSLVDEQNRERGTFTTRGGAALANGAWCFNFPVRACGGLVIGAHLDEGRTTGSFVFQSTVARTAAFTFGPSIQIAWLPNAFHLAFDATLLITPQPSTFQVTGLSPSSLSLPAFQGVFRLSVGLGSTR